MNKRKTDIKTILGNSKIKWGKFDQDFNIEAIGPLICCSPLHLCISIALGFSSSSHSQTLNVLCHLGKSGTEWPLFVCVVFPASVWHHIHVLSRFNSIMFSH